MALHKDVTQAVAAAPDGPQVGAFFDFDGTLMAGFSATEFLKEQIKRGEMSVNEFVETVSTIGSFSLGKIGFSGLMLASARLMKGVAEQSYIEFGEDVYEKQIARLIYPESRALVKAHLEKGHTVAIISSATPYQVGPAAQDLEIEHVLCSQFEVEDGEFTGGIVRPLCFGEGKVIAAQGLADKYGIDMEQSFFYTDSDDDLELLEAVGNPQPLNPNSKLVDIAEKRGWPARRFKSRGRPSATDYVRSFAADMSLIPVFAAGLPIWALTGSKREAQNFSISLFADVASALVGMNVNVRGERYLWEQRPAVFIFNHQSKADIIITSKLLRRDVAGVGKKEIGKFPLMKKIMDFGGTVLIDRENTASAVEAMRPLIDVIRDEGKSVVMAPEGTRTVSPRIGPFKKGAFHLAMQAGVPIIPIVIHNALDVAPKGDFVYRRATVEVEVLPPVDTSNWRKATMNEHVAEVRNMYLDAMGQVDDEPQKKKTKTRKKSGTAKKATRKKAGKVGRKRAKSTAKKKPRSVSQRSTNGAGSPSATDGA
jgi:putative phosphoserine phosphatase/1-acylglycerol-3-phosphate O-acyltransferase